MLNTGWIHWDKYLQPIANLKGPIKLLEVGAYEGSATKWMLKNLATHPESRVYAIDTWEGSPEYVGTDFNEVEETFRRRVKDTGREDQLVTLKMRSEDGLHHLLDSIGKESINFAYIDASHEARDVLSDAVLVWKLMKENGIVVFDDYRWADLEQEFFRPRLAIDSFIRAYAPELRVIHIERQAYVQKLDKSKWITPTLNYKDWSVVMKKVLTLSDAIFSLPNLHIYSSSSSRSTRKAIRTIGELEFTTVPSFSAEDELEEEIHKIMPSNQEIFSKIIIPASMPTIKHPADKKLAFIYLNPSEVLEGRRHDSDISSILKMSIGEVQIKYHTTTFDTMKELISPHLKTFDQLSITSTAESKKSPFLAETLESLETESYRSLKRNTYDSIKLLLIAENAFEYKDYKALKYRGRDSASVKWNSLYVLMATHCLKKEGSLSIQLYGTQSAIVCEFISFVSTFFAIKPSLYIADTPTMVNVIGCTFRKYKGITKKQQAILLNWYTSCKPETYYTSLGVPCKPSVQEMLNNVKQYYKKNLPRVFQVAKQYKELLEKLAPAKRDTIYNYIIGLRINHYFSTITKYIKETPL